MGVGVITIRRFEPGDVAAALVMEEIGQPQPWKEEIFNDELSAENRTYLVADDGAVCGYGGVMLVGDEARITVSSNLAKAFSLRSFTASCGS